MALGVAVNIWWIVTYRRGLPFDIDEAGYLDIAYVDAHVLLSHGPLALIEHLVLHPGIQAPLLPLLAGVVEAATGAHPWALLIVLQLFYGLAVVSVFVLVSREAGRRWALLASVAVAAVPGVLIWSRNFAFALPAAAFIAAALSTQLGTGNFGSRRRSVLWGLALAGCVLSRTMVLGMLPALLIPGLVLLAALGALRGNGWRVWRDPRVANYGLGLVIGGLVSGIWYVTALPGVLHYLLSYGYGSKSAEYGPSHSFFSFSWWLAPARLALDEEVFLPIALALALLTLGGLAGWFLGSYRRNRFVRGEETELVDPPSASSSRRLISRLLTEPAGQLLIFLFLAYLALASTRNEGSGFELLLVPPAVAFVMLIAAKAPRSIGTAATTVTLVAASLAFANQAGWLLGKPTEVTWVRLGPVRALAFNSTGAFEQYASAVLGGCPTIVTCVHIQHITSGRAYLRNWTRPPYKIAKFLHDFAAKRGREPVVLFAVQDPFFNVNTVGLAEIARYHEQWPIGVLSPPESVHASFGAQLTEPRFGEPNFVIIGPPSSIPASHAFSPLPSDKGVAAAAEKAGFRQVGSLTLPDHRVMEIWWHPDRGPLLPHH